MPQLPRRERDVLALSVWEGLSHYEIAVALDPVEAIPDDTDLFELHGVRIHDGEDWSFSIRSGSDALVLVHARE